MGKLNSCHPFAIGTMAKETAPASNYTFSRPFLTGIVGLIILNEEPELQTRSGGAIMLAGMFLYNPGKNNLR
jgi:drug/metabolite transporter (DMT)-like permease